MTEALATPFDSARADAFTARMIDVLNSAFVALLCSVGRRTDLFDTMAGLGHATSEDIAVAGQLDERYVREWLGGMTCAGIVEYDPMKGTFRLPPEHARALTKQAGAVAVSHFCQYVSLIGEVENDIVEAFRSGGGVPYDRYGRFQELMAESSATRFDVGLVDLVLPLIPGAAQQLTDGINVADVGCGRGHAVRLLAAAFPRSTFTGYDISQGAIGVALTRAADAQLPNVRFEVRDAATLGVSGQYDLVTSFDAVHDQAHPDRMLTSVYRSLRPGGTYLCVEPMASSELGENLSHPAGPFLYGISTMHCMTVSLAQGGQGLGAAWGRQRAIELLTATGFADITVHAMDHDRLNSYFIARKPESTKA